MAYVSPEKQVAPDAAVHDPEDLKFGRFELRRRPRMLLADGAPVELGSRAFDLLVALIDADGAPLSNEELLDRVWPGVEVEEHNLTVQIHALRKALGVDRDLVKTIPRHGYRFTGEARRGGGPAAADAGAGETDPHRDRLTNLPAPVVELIGRGPELQELVRMQADCRLLTLTGLGGIGKTMLALQVARELLPRFPDGVWLVDLSPLTDPGLVSDAIAAALGLPPAAAAQSPESIAAALAGKTMLVVLDNCEHLITAAAHAAEALQHGAGGVHILATSREALRADGESLYKVPPLAVPEAGVTDAEEVLRSDAVRLFITRARSAGAHLLLSDAQVVAIGAICRRLDGIPLAIELAAARATVLGVEELSALLDDRLMLLTGGRRTASPRQQTLGAALDWSFDLLSEGERVVLRRLAVFAGGFALPEATAVCSSDGTTASEVVECVANLVAKSLVSADAGGADRRFRLLETTRAYALGKLAESGEAEELGRRHAACCFDGALIGPTLLRQVASF